MDLINNATVDISIRLTDAAEVVNLVNLIEIARDNKNSTASDTIALEFGDEIKRQLSVMLPGVVSPD